METALSRIDHRRVLENETLIKKPFVRTAKRKGKRARGKRKKRVFAADAKRKKGTNQFVPFVLRRLRNPKPCVSFGFCNDFAASCRRVLLLRFAVVVCCGGLPLRFAAAFCRCVLPLRFAAAVLYFCETL